MSPETPAIAAATGKCVRRIYIGAHELALAQACKRWDGKGWVRAGLSSLPGISGGLVQELIAVQLDVPRCALSIILGPGALHAQGPVQNEHKPACIRCYLSG